MTGAGFSPEEGVCGLSEEVSSLGPRDGRRRRLEEPFFTGLAFLGGASSTSELARLGADLDDCEAVSSSGGWGAWSGLEPEVLVELLWLAELFLGLNASLSRPTGEGERLAWVGGGARPVLVDESDGEGLRPSGSPAWKVAARRDWSEDCVSDCCDSCRWAAWTTGCEVVKKPICGELVEIELLRPRVLGSGKVSAFPV